MEKALLEKGFRLDQSARDHKFYYFYYKGKKTKARTKISTGSGYGEYDDNLFAKMKTQLQLESVRQVRDLLECPMSEDKYIQVLQSRDSLPRDD